jgi:hypothetical protein
LPIPKKLVEQVLDAWGHRCVIGGPHCLGVASVADHRCGRGVGGNKNLNVFVALVAACGLCNGEKESSPQLAAECRERGITVPYSGNHGSLDKQAVTKATLRRLEHTPVQDASGQWWWLRPQGHLVPHDPGVPF